MEVLAGFALGLAASLHCGAMCGPLVVALYGGGPAAAGGARGAPQSGWWTPVLLHHTGRALTYGLLGLAAGLIGRVFVTGAFGRSLSIVAGGLLLAMAAGLAVPFANRLARGVGGRVGRAAAWVRGGGGASGWRAAALGAVNALLSCGLLRPVALALVGLLLVWRGIAGPAVHGSDVADSPHGLRRAADEAVKNESGA
jgi:hypothetical protein